MVDEIFLLSLFEKRDFEFVLEEGHFGKQVDLGFRCFCFVNEVAKEETENGGFENQGLDGGIE